MSDTAPEHAPLRVADLSQISPTSFDLRPGSAGLRALADQLGLSGLRKLRLSGTIIAQGSCYWVMHAKLGATVTQPCVVTLEPVTTRIDQPVRRTFLTNWPAPQEEEVEMAADDTIEPLATHIDPHAVMVEALVLALPLYPRAQGADQGNAVFTEPGRTPMRDEDARPFAGLADLHNSLKKDP